MAVSTLYKGRHRRNNVALSLCIAATVFGLIWLVIILAELVWKGVGGLSLSVFTHLTKGPGDNGGLLNPIVGSLIMTTLGTVIGTPIVLLAGTYMAEYGQFSKLTIVVRFINDILLSAPSIVIGLFIYVVLVAHGVGHYSGIAGAVSLAVIVIPVVVRTTEDMLRLIPVSLREAAIGLGAPKWKVITLICYRAAKDGIVTGVLLAVARIAGETAPLLFTSLGNSSAIGNLRTPMASLPVTIYQYAGSAFDDWVQLAWVAALLITVGVLAINIIARVVLRGGK